MKTKYQEVREMPTNKLFYLLRLCVKELERRLVSLGWIVSTSKETKS